MLEKIKDGGDSCFRDISRTNVKQSVLDPPITCSKPGKYLWTTDYGLTPVTSQEIIYMKRLKINTWNKPGKLSFFLRSEINTWNQPGQYLLDQPFLSSRLIPVASQENICGRLIVDQHLKPARKPSTWRDWRSIPETSQGAIFLSQVRD